MDREVMEKLVLSAVMHYGLEEHIERGIARKVVDFIHPDMLEEIGNTLQTRVNHINQKHNEEIAELKKKIEIQDNIRTRFQKREEELEERSKKQNQHIGELSREISKLKKTVSISPITIQSHELITEERNFLRELAKDFARGRNY